MILKDFNKPNQLSLDNFKVDRIQYNYHNSSKHGFICKYNATKNTDQRLFLLEVDKKSLEVTKKQTPATNAVFIGKQKLALLIDGKIEISDTETMLSIGAISDIDKVEDIFEGGVGRFIYRRGNSVSYYDTVTK